VPNQRVTQSVIEVGELAIPNRRVTQSVIELGLGLAIACGTSAVGQVGVPFTDTLIFGGGVAPLTVTVTGGSLPGGLTLNPSTGVISGTPNTSGVFPFTVTVTDTEGETAVNGCSIQINNPSGSTVIVSSGGGAWGPNGSQSGRACCSPEIEEMMRVLRHREMLAEYPYPWTFPRPGAIPVRSFGTITVPAAGVPTVVNAFTVNQGYFFALTHLVVEIISGGHMTGITPGLFNWSLDLNTPDVSSFEAQSVQGFQGVDVPIGSLEIPWPLDCPELFNPNDTIRVRMTNIALSSGPGNSCKVAFIGWRWPD